MDGWLAKMLGEDPNYVPSPQPVPQQPQRTTTSKSAEAGASRSVMLKPLAKGAAASLDQRRLVKNNARKLQRDRAMNRGRVGIGSVTDTAAARAPKRIATSSTAAGNERMERLKKFQEDRARKRAEARAKEPKAPFYVGVYKLETHNKRVAPVPASHKDTIARGRNLSRIVTTRKPREAPKKKEKEETTTTSTRTTRASTRSQTARLATRAAKTPPKKRTKKAALEVPKTSTKPKSVARTAPKRTPKRRQTSTPDGKKDLAVSPAISIVLPTPDKKPVSPEQQPEQPPSPPPPQNTRRSLWKDIEAIGKQATSLTPLIEVLAVSKQVEEAKPPPNLIVPKEFNFGGSIASSIATQKKTSKSAADENSANVTVESAEVEPGIVRFTATPFKTPTAGRSKSRRSRSILCLTERGSHSDKRRKKRGLNPFGGFLDFTGIPMDPMSPLHSTIRDRLQKGENPDDILNDSIVSSEASTPPASILRNSIYVRRSNFAAVVNEVRPEVKVDAAKKVAEMSSSSDPPTAEHFRSLLNSETERLTALCETWEAKVSSSSVPSDEDVAGQIRTTIGQARLLMNKKGRFEQFSGLVDNCANGTGEKKTTVMDLQGFWDLIYFQVEKVDKNFEELSQLESNGWKKSSKENVKPKKSAAVKRKATTAAAAAGGPSKGLKEMMAAKRREMAAKVKDEKDSTPRLVAVVEAVASASKALKETMAEKRRKTPTVEGGGGSSSLLRAAVGAEDAAEKVFEGGFFSVRSPMSRSPLLRITPTNTPGGRSGTGSSTNRRSARRSNVASASMILAASAAGKINFDELGGGM